HVFTAASLKSDENGRWQWDGAPADLSGLFVNVHHADYLAGGGQVSLGTKNALVLKQGLKIAGRVVDQDGEPVKGAAARLGFDRFGSNEPEDRTDDEGQFTLRNCKPGKSLVTIQAEGYSPTFRQVVVEEGIAPLEFRLEPGHTLRVRVVDIEGRPIPGVLFATDTWRSYRTLMVRIDT